MAENNDWYPSTRPAQRAMYGNFMAKIDGYKATLGLSDPQIDRLKLICSLYIGIYDWLVLVEATKSELTKWRDELEKGDESKSVQPPPAFVPLTLPAGAFNGFVTEFREKVGLIKKLDGYTPAIGLDLMIVRVKSDGLNLQEIMPICRYTEKQGFKVHVTGRMLGMKAVNFYYRRRGENNYAFTGYLTNLPGDLTIIPAAPGVPEVGDIRAIYVQDNAEVGQFSPGTQVTLS